MSEIIFSMVYLNAVLIVSDTPKLPPAPSNLTQMANPDSGTMDAPVPAAMRRLVAILSLV